MDRTSGASRFFPVIYKDGIFLRWLRIAAAAFVALAVGSYAVGRLKVDLADSVFRWLSETAAATGVRDEDGQISALSLFLHNFRAMMSIILYGILPFVYLPALMLGINAMSLGFVGAYCVNNGLTPLVYLAGVLPHGVFELTAVTLALSAGFYLCEYATKRIRTKEKGLLKAAFSRAAQLLFLHIAPLLLLAALIEAYVTPALLRAVMGA